MSEIQAHEAECKSEIQAEIVTDGEGRTGIPFDSRHRRLDPEGAKLLEAAYGRIKEKGIQDMILYLYFDPDEARSHWENSYAPGMTWTKATREVCALAKRTGEICGVCFRKFGPDETIYIDRIYEDWSDDGPKQVMYGPVGECCVTKKMKRVSDAAAEADAPRGCTWTHRDKDLGRTRITKTEVWATPARCETCGRHMFVRSTDWSYRREHYFCSGRCESRYYNRLRHERGEAARQKVCPICGEPFTAKRSDAKYCSPACRQKQHRMWKSLLDEAS